jgi:hypothetical protein
MATARTAAAKEGGASRSPRPGSQLAFNLTGNSDSQSCYLASPAKRSGIAVGLLASYVLLFLFPTIDAMLKLGSSRLVMKQCGRVEGSHGRTRLRAGRSDSC